MKELHKYKEWKSISLVQELQLVMIQKRQLVPHANAMRSLTQFAKEIMPALGGE